jgi:exodeoxyribonuclease VII large subunit
MGKSGLPMPTGPPTIHFVATLFTPATNEPDLWTVGSITAYIRELLEIDFRLHDVRVEGELSNFRRARSGHLYFTLKDESAQMPCVMWRSQAERLRFRPADGDAVLVRGRVGVYEGGGRYQLYAEQMFPAGRGDLAQAFADLKERLAAEGLFAEERKQTIPPLPRKIGVVTSADAAALRDILHVLRRRFPLVAVLVVPTLVQGPEAPPQIVRALQWLDGRDDIDTIILSRGGGSIEDLWAFNDEQVARVIFSARHPIISGIGHETDFTIADFVADLRAPTPSAAAEMAVPDAAELQQVVAGMKERLQDMLTGRLGQAQQQISALKRALGHLGPYRQLGGNRQRLDALTDRLDYAMSRHLERSAGRVDLLQARLLAISPLATLERGYAIVSHASGRVVRRLEDVQPADKLSVQIFDGEFPVQVLEGENDQE